LNEWVSSRFPSLALVCSDVARAIRSRAGGSTSENAEKNGEDETPIELFLAGVAELPDSMPFLE